MAKPKKNKSPSDGCRMITRNRKARFLYTVEDTIEAGIVLVGTEVKSLLHNRVSLTDSYARVVNGEAWLFNCHIDEYEQGNRYNHDPRRRRKLLMHKREIRKLDMRMQTKGVTAFVLEMYFSNKKAKVLLGIGKGKKLYDKRQDIKSRDVDRQQARERSDY